MILVEQFEKFYLPYLSLPKKGIIPNSEKLHSIFNYILYQLDTGCQWEKIPIKINPETNKKKFIIPTSGDGSTDGPETAVLKKLLLKPSDILKIKTSLNSNA